MTHTEEKASKKLRFLNAAAYGTTIATLFLLPFFFIPGSVLSLEATKGILFSLGVLLSIIFWFMARLIDGNITIPKSPIITSSIAIVGTTIISALFSPVVRQSFVGSGFDIGTVAMTGMAVLGMIIASIYFQDTTRVQRVLKALFASFWVLFILALFVFFSPVVTPWLAQFFGPIVSGSAIGTWNDFAVFAGVIAILSLFFIEFRDNTKKKKIALSFTLAAVLLVMALVNYVAVWIVVGITALIIFVYTLSVSQSNGERNLPVTPFIVILLSLLFTIGNPIVGNGVAARIGFSNIEIRPSFQTTAMVATKAITQSPATFIFGIGPNRFQEAWLQYRPVEINNTAFWNAEFSSGFGLLPSMVATTGVVGALTWIVFLFVLFLTGIRLLVRMLRDRSFDAELLGSFVAAAYLWVFSSIYVPGSALYFLAWIMTGVFIGVLVNRGFLKARQLHFLQDPRASFFTILGLVVGVIGAITFFYVTIQRTVALLSFSRAVQAPTTVLAEARMQSVLNLVPTVDVYHRFYTEVLLLKFSEVISRNQTPTEQDRAEARTYFQNAEQSALTAIALNNRSYENWLSLLRVYQVAQTLQIEGAYDSIVAVYENAKRYHPTSPSLPLLRAEIEVAANNPDAAATFIQESFTLKPGFADAYITQARLSASSGDMNETARILERAVEQNPRNAGLFIQLGLIRYTTQSFVQAESAFRQAVAAAPTNPDARYFLALALARQEKRTEAKEIIDFLQGQIESENLSTLSTILSGTAALPATLPGEPTMN